jgi:hypothetical protein
VFPLMTFFGARLQRDREDEAAFWTKLEFRVRHELAAPATSGSSGN